MGTTGTSMGVGGWMATEGSGRELGGARAAGEDPKSMGEAANPEVD